MVNVDPDQPDHANLHSSVADTVEQKWVREKLRRITVALRVLFAIQAWLVIAQLMELWL